VNSADIYGLAGVAAMLIPRYLRRRLIRPLIRRRPYRPRYPTAY